MGEKAWPLFVYTMCQTIKTRFFFFFLRTLHYILNHAITVFGASALLLCSTVRMDKMMQDCVCHLFPAPVPLCGTTGVLQGILGLRNDSIWALVHINSFKCHYKIHGAFYWLSWCSEVCLVHWVGVTLFLFFIKVWIRRDRELTQVRGTHYTNSEVWLAG